MPVIRHLAVLVDIALGQHAAITFLIMRRYDIHIGINAF